MHHSGKSEAGSSLINESEHSKSGNSGSSREEIPSEIQKKQPKWMQTPRTAADFSESKSEISSCKDSDYEAWLEAYYEQERKEAISRAYVDMAVDTAELVDRKPPNVLTSLFPPVEKDIWSYSTKYWGPNDRRRHWPLRIKRGKYYFLPSIHPHLNLRSRYGRFHSLLNSAAAVPEAVHKAFICGQFKNILQALEQLDPQLQTIMLCDTLCNFKWFDYMAKKVISRCFCRILRDQEYTEKVYFENTSMDRLEGIALLCALSRNAGNVIQELHMWKMFGHGQSPLLLKELSSRGDFLPSAQESQIFAKIHYLQILNQFSNLTQLSINYAYLANDTGDALLNLRSVRLGSLKKLNLLCLMEERPLVTNPGYGVGGWLITDGVWRRATEWCPELRVNFVFLNMVKYENVILFLSKSIPVSGVYLSSGMDFTFDVPWDVDSTLLELRNWYADTLESLSLHLWHHRDFLDFVIGSKILEEFPNLINFEFIGILWDVETLEKFCCQLSKGVYKLKTLLFWVQEKYTDKNELSLTRRRVDEIRSKYKKKFLVIDIDADIQTYSI